MTCDGFSCMYFGHSRNQAHNKAQVLANILRLPITGKSLYDNFMQEDFLSPNTHMDGEETLNNVCNDQSNFTGVAIGYTVICKCRQKMCIKVLHHLWVKM